jgi:hypothetical protein
MVNKFDPIFIPSYQRSDYGYTKNMVKAFTEHNFDFKFVIEPQEVDKYLKLVGDMKYIHILPNKYCGKGYNIVYQYIVTQLKKKDFFLIDDDISVLLERKKFNEEKNYWHMKNTDDWPMILREFDKYKDYPLVGIAAKQVGWLCKDDFMYFAAPYAFVKYNLSILDKNDYEKFIRNIREFDCERYHLYIDKYSNAILLKMGYITGCLNKYNFGLPTCATAEGGCAQDYKKFDEQQVSCSRYIMNKFPSYAKVLIKEKKHVMTCEVRIDKKALYNYGKNKGHLMRFLGGKN